ncbi:MAG: ribonuclease P protein component [Bacteroidota bacterium]|nr:ribonuclease P protein component [Bacteroidota bacterium]
MKLSFNKAEKLKSKKQIEQLFQKGSQAFIYPFKIIWLFPGQSSEVRAKVLVGASRKSLKKATDRNKMKRRMREAYRRNKTALLESLTRTNSYCNIGIIHVGKEISAFKETEKRIIELLNRLIQDNEKSSG